MSTSASFKNVINLGNSIIGVSILAMPYCFKRCGILMSIVLIIGSGLLTRGACHLLLKSAINTRRRNFEFLAFHTLGSTGKLMVEISILGFLLGSCIAFFVVIGDLGPSIISEVMMIENTQNLRATVLIFLGMFVALPLGLLRKVESLTSCSAASLLLYIFLILKIFAEASPNLFSRWWLSQVNLWEPSGFLSCLPIFSMALSCQPQLFEIFDTLNDPSQARMDSVVAGAVNLCSLVYILVGFLGYVAFCDQQITGNVLVMLPPTFSSLVTKVGFILTVVISYPLCLFPCRTSLHSLLYRRGIGHHDLSFPYIPDQQFRTLTVVLVILTVSTAFILPSIEVVLGFVGSTIGTFICIILPAFIFMKLTSKNTNDRLMAQTIFVIGIFILVMCTSTTLKNASQAHSGPVEIAVTEKNRGMLFEPNKVEHPLPKLIPSELAIIVRPSPASPGKSLIDEEKKWKAAEEKKPPDAVPQPQEAQKVLEVKRQEPPVPHEPDIQPVRPRVEPVQPPEQKAEILPVESANNGGLDPEALKKEDKEIAVQHTKKVTDKESKQEEIIKKLEAQHEEHKKILEEHKQLLKELKLHKESHDVNDAVAKNQAQPILPASSPKPPPMPEKINKDNQIKDDAVIIQNKPVEMNPVPQQKPLPIAVQQVSVSNMAIQAKTAAPVDGLQEVKKDVGVDVLPVKEIKDQPPPAMPQPVNKVAKAEVQPSPKVPVVPVAVEKPKLEAAVADNKPLELQKRSVGLAEAPEAKPTEPPVASAVHSNNDVPTLKPLPSDKLTKKGGDDPNSGVVKNEMRKLLEVDSADMDHRLNASDSSVS